MFLHMFLHIVLSSVTVAEWPHCPLGSPYFLFVYRLSVILVISHFHIRVMIAKVPDHC